jgi:uncharacterized protein YbbC (DUF1343 family)
MTVALGSDLLFESGRLRGRRIGLVANPASVDGSFRHVVDRAASATGVTLAAVFGPQHGFRANLQDNMIETPHARDERRRVPVHSLYSDTREPTAEMLAELDALVIDLQDVGARIYTFTRWRTACARPAGTACRSSSAIARTRLAARLSKGRCSLPGTSRSSGSFRSRCDTA